MKNIARATLVTLITIMVSACSDSAPGGGADQGSITAPVNIGTYPVISYAGTVDVWGFATGDSYYRVDGVSPGGSYLVSLTGTNGNVRLNVFDDTNFSSILCTHFDFSAGDRTCPTDTFGGPSGTALYIHVSADSSNSTSTSFNISVQ